MRQLFIPVSEGLLDSSPECSLIVPVVLKPRSFGQRHMSMFFLCFDNSLPIRIRCVSGFTRFGGTSVRYVIFQDTFLPICMAADDKKNKKIIDSSARVSEQYVHCVTTKFQNNMNQNKL